MLRKRGIIVLMKEHREEPRRCEIEVLIRYASVDGEICALSMR
jgi:hypothetical protein